METNKDEIAVGLTKPGSISLTRKNYMMVRDGTTYAYSGFDNSCLFFIAGEFQDPAIQAALLSAYQMGIGIGQDRGRNEIRKDLKRLLDI